MCFARVRLPLLLGLLLYAGLSAGAAGCAPEATSTGEIDAHAGGPAPAHDDGGLPPASSDALTPPKGLLIGGWKLADSESFAKRRWLDEEGLREAFTKERVHRRTWSGFTTETAELPIERLLDAGAGPRVGYLYVLIMREDKSGDFGPVDGTLHIKHGGRMRAWVDGRLLADAPPPDGEWSEVRTPVTMTGPYDVVLLKLGRGGDLGRTMNVEMRVTAPDGSAIPGVSWYTMRPPGRPSDLDRPEWCGREG